MGTVKHTPELITRLNSDEIFVFGSNTQGIHGAGAARTALDLFGAILGQKEGRQGQSYAIWTKNLNKGGRSVPLPYIKDQVAKLYGYASALPGATFLVTKIGCGLGGFKVEEIAPLFHQLEYLRPNNVILPIEFHV